MTPEDEAELHRLCDMLRAVSRHLGSDSPLNEAVMKASFGLGLAFMRGLRPKIDELSLGVGSPLLETEVEHLRSLGIDPDSASPSQDAGKKDG